MASVTRDTKSPLEARLRWASAWLHWGRGKKPGQYLSNWEDVRSPLSWVPSVALALVLTTAATCSSGSNTQGGITIQSGDTTPPQFTLELVHDPESSGTVAPGGNPGSVMLSSRSGGLDLSVSATDNESGIKDIQFWVNAKSTTCDASGTCSVSGPGLLGAPRFAYPTPANKAPGDVVAAQAFDLQMLDLAQEITGHAPAGGSYEYQIIVYAVVTNYDGVKSQSPEVTASWHE